MAGPAKVLCLAGPRSATIVVPLDIFTIRFHFQKAVHSKASSGAVKAHVKIVINLWSVTGLQRFAQTRGRLPQSDASMQVAISPDYPKQKKSGP